MIHVPVFARKTVINGMLRIILLARGESAHSFSCGNLGSFVLLFNLKDPGCIKERTKS